MQFPSTVRSIGILGGSFDPVHIGHLIVAQDAAERLELSEVVFIPAAVPPHKQHIQQIAAEHRLNMLRLATESNVRFAVSDLELVRGGISYTVDTLQELRRIYPEAELVLIVGSDTLAQMHTWYRPDEILQLCRVAAFLRPGEESVEAIAQKLKLPDELRQKLVENVVDAHRITVSSSDIRMRLAEGLSIRYLVPPEVEMYIYEHGLYQGREG